MNAFSRRHRPVFVSTLFAVVLSTSAAWGGQAMSDDSQDGDALDRALTARLQELGFTGNIEATFRQRLGRPIDDARANLGRLLWFDTITGLNNDNTCAGCHSPTRAFGDTQSIAIGIDNNGIVGSDRTGPRNQRRAPFAVNTALYPTLMWNSRFASLAGDPFDNSKGFQFPSPENLSLSYLPHLLVAQAFIPPTERAEVAGFDFPGDNFAIRDEVLRRLNASPNYQFLFGKVFSEVAQGALITFDHFGLAIAEFEFTLVMANAPIDQYARGHKDALTTDQKRGALLFFGRLGCVQCHAVSGPSNEMFSDFKQHVVGVPQVRPVNSNMAFDGPGEDEDVGLEQVTQNVDDRYRFRSSPLRNLALQPAFFHNGCFTRLEDAVRFHLDVFTGCRNYDAAQAGVAPDLAERLGPIEPVLARVDPLLAQPLSVTGSEFNQLVDFLRVGLLDKRARPENLRRLIPHVIPSGRAPLTFEFPSQPESGPELRGVQHSE